MEQRWQSSQINIFALPVPQVYPRSTRPLRRFKKFWWSIRDHVFGQCWYDKNQNEKVKKIQLEQLVSLGFPSVSDVSDLPPLAVGRWPKAFPIEAMACLRMETNPWRRLFRHNWPDPPRTIDSLARGSHPRLKPQQIQKAQEVANGGCL